MCTSLRVLRAEELHGARQGGGGVGRRSECDGGGGAACWGGKEQRVMYEVMWVASRHFGCGSNACCRACHVSHTRAGHSRARVNNGAAREGGGRRLQNVRLHA